MSLVDTRSLPSLSDGRPPDQSEQSDSEDTISTRGGRRTAWPIRDAIYASAIHSERLDRHCTSIASSTMTDHVPPLTRESSVSSSQDSAVQTDIASVLQGGFVLDSDDGILTIPLSHHEPEADLLCPFQILDCIETFASVRDFKTHVFSHFRGHPLPTSASCFLCEDRFEQTPQDDPASAWNRMLGHMAHDHFRRGQEFGTIRADFALMRWLYDRKIISDHHFKRAQIPPVPTMFPAAGRRPSEISSALMPEAPSPPLSASPTSTVSESSLWSRRSSYTNQTYVTFAGARTERRRRESLRPVIRQMSMT